jgi:hypothetical protein
MKKKKYLLFALALIVLGVPGYSLYAGYLDPAMLSLRSRINSTAVQASSSYSYLNWKDYKLSYDYNGRIKYLINFKAPADWYLNIYYGSSSEDHCASLTNYDRNSDKYIGDGRPLSSLQGNIQINFCFEESADLGFVKTDPYDYNSLSDTYYGPANVLIQEIKVNGMKVPKVTIHPLDKSKRLSWIYAHPTYFVSLYIPSLDNEPHKILTISASSDERLRAQTDAILDRIVRSITYSGQSLVW